MQAKLNIVIKLAKEVGLSVASDSSFKAIEAMEETDRLRLGLEELLDQYDINEELCDQLIQSLNDIKKKQFEIKILESGRNISSVMELKELKSRGVSNLVSIPKDIVQQVRSLENEIIIEQEYLSAQRKKSKQTIVEENNLLPNLNFRVGLSFLLILFASIFVVLGYIASTDERFYDKDFGYWSMLLGGLGCLITLNIFVIRIVQAVRFHMNKQKAIEDLAIKYISKIESEFEASESRLRSRIFGLESTVFSDACKKQLLETKKEIKDLTNKVADNFR